MITKVAFNLSKIPSKKPWSIISRNFKFCSTLLNAEQSSNKVESYEEDNKSITIKEESKKKQNKKDFSQLYDKSLNLIDYQSVMDKQVIKLLMGKLKLDVINNLPADWNDLTDPILDLESYDEPLTKHLYKVSKIFFLFLMKY